MLARLVPHLFPLTALGEIAQMSFIDLGLLISIYLVSARNGELPVSYQ